MSRMREKYLALKEAMKELKERSREESITARQARAASDLKHALKVW